MRHKIPRSPFATRLSGSARETELRIRNLFQATLDILATLHIIVDVQVFSVIDHLTPGLLVGFEIIFLFIQFSKETIQPPHLLPSIS